MFLDLNTVCCSVSVVLCSTVSEMPCTVSGETPKLNNFKSVKDNSGDVYDLPYHMPND